MRLLILALFACGSAAPAPDAGALPHGALCETGDECEGFCLDEFADGLEFGMCSSQCVLSALDTCPDGLRCITYARTGESRCFLQCDSGCPDEWDCLPSLSICLPASYD